MTEASEIEKTIKAKIEEERRRGVSEIVDKSTDAVNRLNGVYISCMKTLEQLKLVDSDLFKFFWKTKGNVKVIEYTPNYDCGIGLVLAEGSKALDIILHGKKSYRIVVLVTEVEEKKTG